jgi:hypothetical protein
VRAQGVGAVDVVCGPYTWISMSAFECYTGCCTLNRDHDVALSAASNLSTDVCTVVTWRAETFLASLFFMLVVATKTLYILRYTYVPDILEKRGPFRRVPCVRACLCASIVQW